ncbi:hypothetical protein MTR_5g454250 [Medicago truncatula]|uniref:Putative plant transposon protein domain-containing protein n=1 Tax=Medicago truncatula TaxID=3880 RepID=A0A072UEW1_MEDTR|nr:hypothetical protein MTR_5g454250 [Medicago truncatula]
MSEAKIGRVIDEICALFNKPRYRSHVHTKNHSKIRSQKKATHELSKLARRIQPLAMASKLEFDCVDHQRTRHCEVFVEQIRIPKQKHDLVHLYVITRVENVKYRVRNLETGTTFEKGSIFAIFWATRHGELHHSPSEGMAPKKPVNTGKRKKGDTSAPRPPPRNQAFERERFRSRYHQDRYIELLDQSMWCERVFNLNPEGPFKEIAKLLLDRGWERLLKPLTDINAELVREFYANALPENPYTDPFTFETFVRGRTIRFDREAINTYLGNPFELNHPDDIDDFHDKQNRGHFILPVPHEEIKRFILLEGYNYDISEAGREYRAQYKFMTNEAKIIQKLILYNVVPNSHLSDCVVEVCPLIYYILKGIKVDIARTIAWELRMITLQGRGEREARLSFPGLIMGVIKDTGMRLPTNIHEKIINPINDAFITRYILGETKKDKGKGKQASSSQVPHPHPGPEPFQTPSTAAFDFASYAQWQHQSNMHTWNMLAVTPTFVNCLFNRV